MKLALLIRDRLQAVSPAIVSELEQLVARANTVWRKDHDPDVGGHTGLTWTGTTQTTVGAAGAATALPATPSGYLVITVAGTEMVIPYYAKS